MRVFVLTTGRSGSVTFAKACGHMVNLSAAHESRASLAVGRLEYPDDHIEIDNRLSWFLGPLHESYPEARYVHLTRERDAVARSYVSRWEHHAPSRDDVGAAGALRRRINPTYLRGNLLAGFAYGVLMRRWRWPDDQQLDVARLMVDTINANVRTFLRDKPHLMVRLEHAQEDFGKFWSWVGAEGDRDSALATWATRHNATTVE